MYLYMIIYTMFEFAHRPNLIRSFNTSLHPFIQDSFLVELKQSVSMTGPIDRNVIHPQYLPTHHGSAYAPKEYHAKKVEFIRKMKDEGVSHTECTQRWNESTLKRELLSTLEVGELIRRRFCPKGTKTNPWA